MVNNTNLQRYIYFWLALSLGMVFVLYSHLLEILPNEITHWLGNPAYLDFGKFNPQYAPRFYFFLMLELFAAGILLDKFGIRLLASLAILVVILGIYFFAQVHTNSTTCLILSRILMGCSIAFVTGAYIKVVAGTMPGQRFALMGGIFVAAALLGSFVGDTELVGKQLPYTWQQSVLFIATGALGLTALFSMVSRDNHQSVNLPDWKEIRQALTNSQNWLLAGYSGLAFAPIAILGGFAGKPFFAETYQYNNHKIIELGCFMLVGLSIGAPLVGYLSTRIKGRRVFMLLGILIQELTFLPLIYVHGIPYWFQAVLLMLFGLASGTFILSFVLGKEINSLAVVATIISLIEIGIIFITAVTDQIFGRFLIWDWDGKMVDGMRYFSVYEYHLAFMIFPVYLLLGFVLLLFIDEPIF